MIRTFLLGGTDDFIWFANYFADQLRQTCQEIGVSLSPFDFLATLMKSNVGVWVMVNEGSPVGFLALGVKGEEAEILYSKYSPGLKTVNFINNEVVPWAKERGAKVLKSTEWDCSPVVERYLKRFRLFKVGVDGRRTFFERKI